jgi:hypothetical protein
MAIVAMFNQFCYRRNSRQSRVEPGRRSHQACIDTLANIFYRAIYYREVRPR